MKPVPPSEPDLLAFLRGDLPREEAEALRARLAAEPALEEEVRRLEAFFRASREAFDPAEDPREAERVAAQVRSLVAAEERREARERRVPERGRVRGRAVWMRVLAASVFVHAVVIVSIVATSPTARVSERESRSLLANLPQQRIETEQDLLPTDIAWPKDGGLTASLPDPLLPEAAELGPVDGLPPANVPDGLPSWSDRLREHPPAVALDMLFRTDDALKRRRLVRLEIDPDGTFTLVRRGLGAIRRLQREDGSFAAAGDRTEVGETALALLPFLGDGLSSAHGDVRAPDEVAKGMRWLRRTLFADGSGGTDVGVGSRPPKEPGASVPVKDRGIALAALAEDFMLSFGRFSPAEAGRRVAEMEVLARGIARQQGTEGAFDGAAGDPSAAAWPIWGLYAAARTGTVALPAEPIERFRRWYDARPRTVEGMPMRADGSPDPVLAAVGLLFGRGLDPQRAREGGATAKEADQAMWVVSAGLPERDANLFAATAGSALLLHDPAVFRAWGRETFERIAARLQKNGEIRDGDPVGDTALVLLALQAAYRTY